MFVAPLGPVRNVMPTRTARSVLVQPIQLAKRIFRSAHFMLMAKLANIKLEKSPHSFKLLRLGSTYGGWTFVDTPGLRNSTVVCCGLGEDASFDVEFATRFAATVIQVDPTPRAIAHWQALSKNLGSKSTTSYVHGGHQPIGAYDLSDIVPGQLRLYPKALWNETKTLRFFSPPNATHVSHSIINFQNGYRSDTAAIDVEAVTIDTVLADHSITSLDLLKIDIEGAEIEVIQDMLKRGIFPKQLLVEYDELSVPSRKSKARIHAAHHALLSHGYRLIHIDNPCNFLYTMLPDV